MSYLRNVLLMEKRYSLRLYLAGAVAARAGDEMSGPALMLTGFALAGSPTDASSLLAGITISAAVGGPVLGHSSTEQDGRDACWLWPSSCMRRGWG